MKRIYIGSLLALTIIFAGAWWRHSANQRPPVKHFPDGEKPRRILPIRAHTLFNKSQDVTIYVVTETGDDKKPKFHDYKIVEQAKLNALQATNLRTVFLANTKRKGMKMLCFWPQHGIRMKHQGQILDFLICFQCGYIYTYFNGKETRETFSSEGSKDFNALWKSAGLSPEKSPIPPG